MDLQKLLCPTSEAHIFREEGYCVWCGTMTEKNGIYYLYYSRWPRSAGSNGWVSHSEICLATSQDPLSGFQFQRVILPPSGIEGRFDRDVTHNPMLLEWKGKYYLYYMGTYGNGDFWNYRNHQRIGVAYCDTPDGDFVRMETPVIDTGDGYDAILTSNPSVTVGRQGELLMMYKGVGAGGEMPMGTVVSGIAVAEHPLGPFRKDPAPVNANPNAPFSVEDPFVFYDAKADCYRALIRDMHGFFTGTGRNGTALLYSENGHDWQPDPHHPLAYHLSLPHRSGGTLNAHRLERPFLFFRNGSPKILCCAITLDREFQTSGNIHIQLKDS